MKKSLIILTCLILCIPEMHGQSAKNILRGAKAIVGIPKIYVKYEPIPAFLTIVPENTSIKTINQMMQESKFYEYRLFDLPKGIKPDETLIGRFNAYDSNSKIMEDTIKNFTYDPTHDNTTYFKYKKDLPAHEFDFKNYHVSLYRSGETRPLIQSNTPVLGSTIENKQKKNLFGNIDTLRFWRSQFLAFLDAHGNDYKSPNNEYIINTSEDPTINPVSFAFASFLKEWTEKMTVTRYSGSTCWRFLTEKDEHGKRILHSVQENAWRNWFLRWYQNNYKGKENELKANRIHQQVLHWLETY